MSRIVRIHRRSLPPARTPPRLGIGLILMFVALMLLGKKLGTSAEPIDLRTIADTAPALYLREEAVLGLAEEGDAAVVPDLIAMLDHRNLPDMREAANAALVRLVGQSFAADETAARAWLRQSGRSVTPATSVGGRDLAPWPGPISCDGPPSVRVVAAEDELVVTVGAPLPPQFNVVMQLEVGTLVFEATQDGEDFVVLSKDVPDAFRALDRHAPMKATPRAGVLTFALPRLGCLAGGTPPRSLQVIVPSEP